MITREEYLNALELIDQYHHQLKLSYGRQNSLLGKTPLIEWKKLHKSSRRVENIVRSLTDHVDYLEDITEELFLRTPRAGGKSWKEFLKLRNELCLMPKYQTTED